MTELQAKLVRDACGNAYKQGYKDGVSARDSQIIRCKDCVWYSQVIKKADGTPNKSYKKTVCTLGGESVWRDPDWFCANAERIEKETE